MPVRIFTYLMGTDSSSQDHMHWMACNNKGNILKIYFFCNYIINFLFIVQDFLQKSKQSKKQNKKFLNMH